MLFLAFALSKPELGAAAVLLAYATGLSNIADMGSSALVQRKDIRANPGALSAAFWMRFIASLALAAGAYAIDFFSGIFMGFGAFVSLAVLFSFFSLFPMVLNSLSRFKSAAVFEFVSAALFGALTVFFAWQGWKIEGVLFARIASFALAGIPAALFVANVSKISARFSIPQLKSAFSFGFFATVLNLSAFFYTYFDSLALFYLKGAFEAGIYRVLLTVAQGLLFIGIAVSYPLMAVLSEHLNSNKPEKVAAIHKSMTFFIVFASVPAVVFLSFFGNALLGFFGKEMAGFEAAFALLLLSQFFMVLATTMVAILFMKNKAKLLAKIGLLTAFVNVALNLVLVPQFGVFGAAFASFAALATAFAAENWWFSRNFPLEWEWNRYLAVGGLSLASVVFAAAFSSVAGIASPFIALLVGVAAYVSLAFLTRTVSVREIALLFKR